MFEYFYAQENEQFIFLQLPIMLIKDNHFKKLSDSSKILYSLLLNRTSLSMKNGWTDEKGRVYIIYPLEEIMQDLNCWDKKATKSMNELKELGLIKSVRQGLGKPNIIYVMNFATALKYKTKSLENGVSTLNRQNDDSGNVKMTIQESVKSTIQKSSKAQTIYNDYNNNDNNNINYNHIESYQALTNDFKTDKIRYDNLKEKVEVKKKMQKNKENFEIVSAKPANEQLKSSKTEYDYNMTKEIIQDNIGYKYMAKSTHIDKNLLDDIVEIIVNTILTDYTNGYINIGTGENRNKVSAEVVKSTFFKLKNEHIQYTMHCFKQQTKQIYKFDSYIRNSLFTNYRTANLYNENIYQVDFSECAD